MSEQPALALAPVAVDDLCVTRGRPLSHGRIDVPTFRAVAPDLGGDAAAMRFIARGPTRTERALASGELRRQVGLKLRADNGCNVVYVMWRVEPRPKIAVSVKRNLGMRTAKECGAAGYVTVRPRRAATLPALESGTTHELAAEIVGDVLSAWIDGQLVWEGVLPEAARALTGPAGIRTDDLDVDVLAFSVEDRAAVVGDRPACVDHADLDEAD